jgi:hypothetical protein
MNFWVLLEPEAEAELQSLRTEYRGISSSLLHRFDRGLTEAFGILETFPLAFPVVQEDQGWQIRRVLLRGFSKALLYFVLEELQEVRVITCYDTRSAKAQPRQT